MQATITYLLTEQAQRAQMAATGLPVARKQTVVDDLMCQWLDHPLVSVDAAGVVTSDLTQIVTIDERGRLASGGYTLTRIHPELDAMPASGLVALETISARIAAKQAECHAAYVQSQAVVAERRRVEEIEGRVRAEKGRAARDETAATFLADLAARAKIDSDGEVHFGGVFAAYPGRDKTSGGSPVSELMALAIAEAVRRRDADIALEEAKEVAKAAYIGQWMCAHADEEARSQFDDGLLCRKAAVALIADAAFTAAGVLEAANVQTCDSRDCLCGQQTVDCLPRNKYLAWKQIKAGLPDGFVVEFSRYRACLRESMAHSGWGDENETAGLVQYLAEITIPHGPFRFVRTVEL
jgi:hypothetical protein